MRITREARLRNDIFIEEAEPEFDDAFDINDVFLDDDKSVFVLSQFCQETNDV